MSSFGMLSRRREPRKSALLKFGLYLPTIISGKGLAFTLLVLWLKVEFLI